MTHVIFLYCVVIVLLLTILILINRKKKYDAVLHVNFNDEEDHYIRLEFLSDIDEICSKKDITVRVDAAKE